MIICKRPVPPDDHLQVAGPSKWSFARGRSNNNNPGDQGDKGLPGVKGRKEYKKENEKEEKKFLRADGHTDQPNKVSTRGP